MYGPGEWGGTGDPRGPGDVAGGRAAGRKDSRHRGRVAAGAVGCRLHIAPRVLGDAEVLDHARVHRVQVSYREEHELRRKREFGAGYFLDLRAALLVLHPLDVTCGEALDLAVLAFEALGRHREIALRAFLVRGGGGELERPVRTRERLVLLLGRLRHQLEVHHRLGSLAERSADAVAARIAAADHDHMLARGHDLARDLVARDFLVLQRQEVHREVDAVQVAPRNREVARLFRSSGQCDRVELGQQPLGGNGHADMRAGANLHALRAHLLDTAVDEVLLHLEIGNAVAQQPADAIALLEERHVMAGARELLRARHARGTGADHRDLLAGLAVRNLRPHPALGVTLVDDRLLDRLDRHRVVVDVEHARGFARRGAHAAGELGDVGCRVQDVERLAPVVAVNEIVPVGNDVVHRAAGLAEGNAAVHAARALLRHLLVGERPYEFLVDLDALRNRRIGPVLALDLHEAGDLAH